jgi:hypothetical protein
MRMFEKERERECVCVWREEKSERKCVEFVRRGKYRERERRERERERDDLN